MQDDSPPSQHSVCNSSDICGFVKRHQHTGGPGRPLRASSADYQLQKSIARVGAVIALVIFAEANDSVHALIAPATPARARRSPRRAKNGPALAGHGAEAVRDAITRTMLTFPAPRRQSLTSNKGAEISQLAHLRIDTWLKIHFCDPCSPRQRGTNENTNGLLRQYVPKGADLSAHGATDFAAVTFALTPEK